MLWAKVKIRQTLIPQKFLSKHEPQYFGKMSYFDFCLRKPNYDQHNFEKNVEIKHLNISH